MAIKVVMPKLAITMSKGRITKWLKKEGDTVEKGDDLFEIETEKIQSVVKAHDSGVLRKIVAPSGAVVPVAGVVAIMTAPGEAMTEEVGEITPASVAVQTIEQPRKVEVQARPDTREKVSPVARRLAEKHGIDIAKVTGTGPDGRIVKEDILREVEKKQIEPIKIAETRELSVLRKVIAERLSQSHLAAVHVTITTSADMTKLIQSRERLGPLVENKTGTKLSYTDIMTRIVALVLKEFPMLNSTLEDDKIKIFADINIGVAVALEDSLIVPVVHNADNKTLGEITLTLKEKVDKARRQELTVDDVTGGTFTISNLGIYDVEVFTPVINPPQCALLGIGKMLRKPWVENDQVVIRPIATLSLSFDHRIVDGAHAARFLQKVKETFENPESVLG